jgi:hypothetical protein
MKTIQLLAGVLHVPSPKWSADFDCIAALPVVTGDTSIRVVHVGEKIELSDSEANHLIQRGVAIEWVAL